MKKKKSKSCGNLGAQLTAEERERIVNAWIDQTKPEDLFPRAYQRAVQSLTKAGLL
jgi:hypothetical protein